MTYAVCKQTTEVLNLILDYVDSLKRDRHQYVPHIKYCIFLYRHNLQVYM